MRERICAVMRYAGPRMMYRHPMLAFYHLIDGMRKEPSKPMRDSDSKGRGKAKDPQHAGIC
jgi:hypothetical protein